jgi:hypothetical protein
MSGFEICPNGRRATQELKITVKPFDKIPFEENRGPCASPRVRDRSGAEPGDRLAKRHFCVVARRLVPPGAHEAPAGLNKDNINTQQRLAE